MTTSVLKWLWSKSTPLEELTQIHVLCWSCRAWQCSVLDTAKLSLVLTLPLPELPPGPCFRGDHLHPTAGVSMSWVLAGNAPPPKWRKAGAGLHSPDCSQPRGCSRLVFLLWLCFSATVKGEMLSYSCPWVVLIVWLSRGVSLELGTALAQGTVTCPPLCLRGCVAAA